MKMTFNRVLQLILIFFGLARKYADKASEEAAKLGNIYVENSTLFMHTGYVGDKILDADITNGTFTAGITERELDLELSGNALNINFT